jgi:glycerol-3-phosphate acyltransferase PlsY
MFLIAIAPMIGHMFSPFLAFKGGKALAAALGVWVGLTIWKASLPAVIAVVIGIIFFTSPGWAVMLSMIAILITLLCWLPTPLLLSIWTAMTFLLAWTHRTELRRPPHLRSWLKNYLTRPNS